MEMRSLAVTLSALALTSCSMLPFGDGGDTPTAAKEADVPPIAVANSWATVAPTGVKQAAGFLTITNTTAADDRLVSASSSRAGHMELHEMGMEGSMTTMRQMKSGLAIPAGATVALKPTGSHLMFLDLSSPLSVGDTVTVTLTFEKAGAMQVDLPVRTMAAMQ
jgi:periplasmic copper chaperone A